MLNISKNKISEQLKSLDLATLNKVEAKKSSKVLRKILIRAFVIFIITLLMPWTQNIRSNGKITTLSADHRPQTIHTVIGGQIQKWYVKEGDRVRKGDTIAFLSEIKPDYFDPQLLERTQSQAELKKLTAESYKEKVAALENQIKTLGVQRDLKLNQANIKLKQAKLKVSNDSISFQAASIAYKTAFDQYERIKQLFDQGLKSKTDLENRRVKMQDALSKKIGAENKFLASQAEAVSAKIEISNIRSKFEQDLAKAQSDKFSALSNQLDSEGSVNKLENQYSNYQIRNGMYYVLAPQDCFITKLIANGIGETVKEGAPLLTIMPMDYRLAAEIYIDPIDLPLLRVGEHVRLQFDGWPAIVFSGWPNVSYGTYGGTIYAIDQYISENGKYRVLIKEDPLDHPWPEALRFGGGTSAMILLNDVPVGYEMWRKINGFPPDFYKGKFQKTTHKLK